MMPLTNRIAEMRENLRSQIPIICVERARLVTEFYKKPSMDPVPIRKAKMFKYILDNMTVYIKDPELIVGNHASMFRGIPVFPEMGTEWILRELDTFRTRETDPLNISDENIVELRSILGIWSGSSFNEIANSVITDEVKEAERCGLLSVGVRTTTTGHNIPDYDKLLAVGLNGLLKELDEKIANAVIIDVDDYRKYTNWQAMKITCQSVIDFANRYADLAKKKAAEEGDPKRKAEMEKISRICQNVPANQPRGFHEAVQFVYFIHLCIQIESNGHGISFGRFDQYVYPYFCMDYDTGKITDAEAVEILQCMWIKITEIAKVRDSFDAQAFAGYPMWQNMIIGGQTIQGKDACNKLTEFILEATDAAAVVQPSVSLRCHKNMDQKIFRRALMITQRGLATPAFFNDELVIPILLAKGATVKDARNWAITGCVEPFVPGKGDGRPVVGYVNSLKIIEMVLNNGVDPLSGIQFGPKTGDPREFTSMDQFMEAYKTQVEFFNDMMLVNFNRVASIHADIQPSIFNSATIEGCIESGKSLQEGGAIYNYSGTFVTALANAADSLAVIEQLVFNQKAITMDQLIAFLKNNFEDHEEIRQMLINKAPKYGNDIDQVDEYARKIVDIVVTHTDNYKDNRGGRYIVSILSQSFNVLQGKSVGATPDGRLAFSPLSNNASPANGADVNGPTAVLRSAAKIDQFLPLTGTLLNLKFDPDVVKGEKGLDILGAIIKSYFEDYGEHVQINIVDVKSLRDAQRYPENYRNLMVRVAGYSAYFVDLDPHVQEDIILRTEQKRL